MKDWTIYEKSTLGTKVPKHWSSLPMVGFTKNGLTINEVAFKAYFGNCTQVMLLSATENGHRMVGIKPIPRGEESPQNFTCKKSTTGARSYNAGSQGFMRQFSDLFGLKFRCHQDPQSRIVEVDLSPENRVKE